MDEFLKGTAAVQGNEKFVAMPARMWLYVGRVNDGVDAGDVKAYIGGKCGASVDEIDVKQLNTRGSSNAFQVGLLRKHYGAMESADAWPEGIIVRRFRFFRGNNHRQGEAK